MIATGPARPLLRGRYCGKRGTFWAWKIDGYYDLHFVSDDAPHEYPGNSDEVCEFLPTLAACRKEARMTSALDAWGAS